MIKSIFQIFEDDPLDLVLPTLAGFIDDKANRHKQRAAGELIGGEPRTTDLSWRRACF